MERSISSKACSSSSAAPLRESFPRDLMKKRVQLVVCYRNISLLGTVMFVSEEVCLKVARPKNPLLLQVGKSAQLKAEDGRRWSGTISFTCNEYLNLDEPGLYDFVLICMEAPAENKVFPEAKNILVMVNPVRLNLLVQVSPHVRVAVNGFGDFEQLIIDMVLQSLNMQLVAIYSPVPPEIMVKVWKSPNVSISVKDDDTVIFEKCYYEKDGNEIFVKSEQMEVTVFRKPDGACWKRVNAHFVVECVTCFSNDIGVQSKGLIRFQIQPHGKETMSCCLRFLPQALYFRELYVAEPTMRFRLNNGNQYISARCEAEEQDVFADFSNEPTSLRFLAATVFLKNSKDADMSRDPKLSNLDLQVTLGKSENYSDIEGIHAWSCASSKEVGERLIAIMSLCIDIVRVMPVGGCRLVC